MAVTPKKDVSGPLVDRAGVHALYQVSEPVHCYLRRRWRWPWSESSWQFEGERMPEDWDYCGVTLNGE